MISLDKIRMNIIKTSINGVVDKETVFIFSQNGNIVSASYSGGKIKQGYLIGTIENDKLTFGYCQIQTDNKIDNGQSICQLLIGENGKFRLIENFKWLSRDGNSGTNIFEEF